MVKLIVKVVLLCIFLSGCDKSSDVEEASRNIEQQNYPIVFSKMNGWHGLNAKKLVINAKTYCIIDVPKEFGLTIEERNYLNYIAINSNVASIAMKEDCYTTNIIYIALDQLKLLATKNQDRETARLIIFEGSEAMPFELDGEVAEAYTGDYLIPVLRKYKELSLIIDSKKEDDIARSVCADFSWQQDIKKKDAKKKINDTVAILKAKGLTDLANKIIKGCISIQ